LFVLGVIGLAETVGFFFLQDWTRALIPWELNRLAGIFLSSICAASACPILWIALSQEYAALTAGGMDFMVMFAGFAGFSFQAYAANPRQPVLVFGLICTAGFLTALGLIYFGLRHPFNNARRVPGLVRFSFGAFAANLVVTGLLLVLGRPNVFPWQLTHQQSVLYGWIFLGAAGYFLVYDLILIVPFVALLFGREPFLAPNLLYYIAVLVYSGGLAVYFLFVRQETRISFKSA
jgi:hypothetical protein